MARTGLRRGLLEGSRGWLYVGVGATAVGVLRKLLTEEETVYRTELKQGEGLELRVVEPKR
jgi:hypothetical protein